MQLNIMIKAKNFIITLKFIQFMINQYYLSFNYYYSFNLFN